MTSTLARFARVLLLAIFAMSALPSTAAAVGGLDSLGLTWGMSVQDVKAAHVTKYEKSPKSQPDGTVGGRLLLTKDVEMFGDRLEVAVYFDASGLSIIRLQYRKPAAGNVEKLVEWYQPHWGEPLSTTERRQGRKKKTWSWPWEGVEIRSVVEDGSMRYQRVDFSQEVAREWNRADAMLCSLLPTTTGCPFAGSTCPQQDSQFADGRKEQEWNLLGSKGELSCTYQGYRLKEMRLVFERPREKTSKWMRALLLRRIGTGLQDRDENSSRIKVTHDWPTHQLNLRIDRKAVSKKDDGTWTGPVERIRLKMVLAAPSDQPELIAPPQ
jgi:hypothetical protein